ncbi:TrbI/VirB10 family protein [Stenotrophomonas sp. JAI102]|uniref:TrbI/VirB10 family protein n=1 Tax=Stenotrophomonas sp. JAI102 TaxID=2723077 RepID=UPI0015C9B6C2|nr:TrbI/VirB10 family protein [Stenotrophomonas sp. JAI102]NYF34783.1 type IV secretion system protein VirB10 [Stenotrophomonas sp. JAI102]
MSQNTTPGNDPYDGREQEQGPQGNGPAAGETHSNPYFGTAQPAQTPDLDAAAPQLRSAEEQRLNRKALAFLAGILLLVVAMGYLLLRGSGDKDAKPVTGTPVTSTPELPNLNQGAPAVPVAPADPIPMLPPSEANTQPTLVPLQSPEPMGPRVPTLLERRLAGIDGAAANGVSGGPPNGQNPAIEAAARSAMMAQMGGQQPGGPARLQRGPDVEDVSNASFIRSPDALLVRGTYLRCVLETRIITDYAGYTSCLLTEPVYSINGRSLLLPKGSKIYGSYGGRPTGKRVEVIWDRITTPNGLDVAMSSPGIDGLGSAGHPGQYDAHWGARIGSALMISLIADAFKYAAAENGPETTTVTGSGLAVQSPYESATARTMERLAGEALSERSPPTVTINQGTVLAVYVAKDVDFSDVLSQRR